MKNPTLSSKPRRALVPVVLGVALGGIAATGVTMMQPRVYESQATVFVSVPQESDRIDRAYQGTLFTQAQVRSYAELATTPRVTSAVIQRLGLEMTAAELAEQLQVQVPVDSVLLNVTVSDTSPQRAAGIADAVTTQLVSTVSELETPAGRERPSVRLEVVRPGEVATVPASPRPLLNLALGLVLGAVAGLGAAAARNALDTRVRDAESAAAVARRPVLAEIPFDRPARKRPLDASRDPFGPRAEAFRRLRTNLRFVDVDRPPRTLLVTSPYAGDGKTSIAVNLAFALAAGGARVMLMDADLRRPAVAGMLDLVGSAGLTSVLSGQAALDEVLQSAGDTARIGVLTGGPVPPNPGELLGGHRMGTVLRQLRERADYVIVDSAPLLPVADSTALAPAVEGVLLVVRPRTTRRPDLNAVVESLERVNANLIGLAVNMTRGAKHNGRGYYSSDMPVEEMVTETGRHAANV